MKIYDPKFFDDLAENKQALRQWQADSLRTAAHYCERKGTCQTLRIFGKDTHAEALESMALEQADVYRRVLEQLETAGGRLN